MELINVGDPMEDLYRAAMRGDEQTLQQLLERDATILNNIPEEGLQTPLHISALLGHLPFTVLLLKHQGNLAVGVDSCGRTALHLASAEGHVHIVRELLQVNNELCVNTDSEGKIPLHYAAMRGRTEVVRDLIIARPDSLSLGDAQKSTAFHLCVTYNHLNTLKILVKLEYATVKVTPGHQPRLPIFTRPDQDGDTILHLAIILKQVEVIRYLLSIPEIREIANAGRKLGRNILKKDPKDLNISEIRYILENVKKEGHESDDVVPTKNVGGWIKFLMKWIWNYYLKSLYDWWTRDGDKWLEEMKGNLSVVSTFIATITFAGLINPPGGFIQQNLAPSIGNNVTSSYDDPLNCIILPNKKKFCPGQALASSYHLNPLHHPHFERYVFYITLSFFSSLSVTLLLVSGVFSMKNKTMIWMLSMLMCITLTSLAAAYVTAMNVIIPYHVLNVKSISNVKHVALNGIWKALLWIIVYLISLRFYVWVVHKSSRWVRHGPCGKFLCRLFTTIAYLIAFSWPIVTLVYIFPVFGI